MINALLSQNYLGYIFLIQHLSADGPFNTCLLHLLRLPNPPPFQNLLKRVPGCIAA